MLVTSINGDVMNIVIGRHKTRILMGICLAVILAVIYFNYQSVKVNNSGRGIDSSVLLEIPEVSTNTDPNPILQNGSVIGDSTTSSNSEIVWLGTEEQIAELDEWQISRGWFDTSNANQDDYKTYSKEALEELAKNGDIKALHLLEKSASLSESKDLMLKAAVYGSTRAFANLINIATTEYSGSPTEIEAKETLINIAVFSTLAQMRSDFLLPLENEVLRFEKKYAVTLDDADLQLVAEKSSALYNDLERQREQLGLGKFDNSIPPVVQAYYKAQQALK